MESSGSRQDIFPAHETSEENPLEAASSRIGDTLFVEPALDVQRDTLSVKPMIEVQPVSERIVEKELSPLSLAKELDFEIPGDTPNKVESSTTGELPFSSGMGAELSCPLPSFDGENCNSIEVFESSRSEGLNGVLGTSTFAGSSFVSGSGDFSKCHIKDTQQTIKP